MNKNDIRESLKVIWLLIVICLPIRLIIGGILSGNLLSVAVGIAALIIIEPKKHLKNIVKQL